MLFPLLVRGDTVPEDIFRYPFTFINFSSLLSPPPIRFILTTSSFPYPYVELMLTPSYQSQPTMYPLIVFEIVKASLNHGINSSSANAFACYGLILCAFGKLREGQEMSKAVQLICAKYGMSHMLSRCAFVCEGAIRKYSLCCLFSSALEIDTC